MLLPISLYQILNEKKIGCGMLYAIIIIYFLVISLIFLSAKRTVGSLFLNFEKWSCQLKFWSIVIPKNVVLVDSIWLIRLNYSVCSSAITNGKFDQYSFFLYMLRFKLLQIVKPRSNVWFGLVWKHDWKAFNVCQK